MTEARARVSSLNLTWPPPYSRNGSVPSGAESVKFSLIAFNRGIWKLPQLDGLFRDLNVQLEGTENRIATARGRYIKEVQEYNTFIRQFPTLITAKIFGYKVLPNFGVENQDTIMERPTIRFDNPRPAQ